MKLKHSLFVALASFSSPPKPIFLSQAGLFFSPKLLVLQQQRGGQATEDVFSAGGAGACPEQGQALGSGSSFSHQPGTSTAPFRNATHSQLLYLKLLRVSLSRQDLKCIKATLALSWLGSRKVTQISSKLLYHYTCSTPPINQ